MARPPTRTQSRRLFSSLFAALCLFVAILCFTAPSVKAEEAEGVVIGIGAQCFLTLSLRSLIFLALDLGTTYVYTCHS